MWVSPILPSLTTCVSAETMMECSSSSASLHVERNGAASESPEEADILIMSECQRVVCFVGKCCWVMSGSENGGVERRGKEYI